VAKTTLWKQKMFEHIKKRIVKGLIEEISCLDATGIELVGHNYISLREGKHLIHHGINKDYKPSGYTVDSFSDDSTVVGEYSTEIGYFDYSGNSADPVYEKINKDIAHAISHKKPLGPERIYLVSNQEENPSFRAKFNATEDGQNFSEKITIVDARELAKGIYDQSINNPIVADFYKQFFPSFSQNLDNYEYFGKLPKICENHISEARIINSIASHYDNGNKICVLYGVSGSGKTQAAIDFIHSNTTDFYNYIWISGEDWRQNATLSSVQRTRGGVPINVAGLFNSTKSILVIDDCSRDIDNNDFEELKIGFDKGGIVLLTSQISVPQSQLYLSIPQFSKGSALEILGEDPFFESQICNEFISKCRFSPLILSMTKKLASEQGVEREIIYREVLSDPELIDDAQGLSIIKKILRRLEPKALEALKKIANSGQNSHDAQFLRYYIGGWRCNTLQKLSILVPEDTLGVLRVHDLVLMAVRDRIDSRNIASEIESYISDNKGDMKPNIFRQIHLCFDQLHNEHLRRGNRDIDWIHYALLQCDSERKREFHKDLHELEITPNSSFPSVKTIIDAKEIHSYTITDLDLRRAYYEECIALYDVAIKRSPSKDILLELLHHKGKALRRCRKHDEALDTFNNLLELEPKWHATHGQIAHLGSQNGVGKEVRTQGENSMRILLHNMLSESYSIPLRVSLSAFARLRSYHNIAQELNRHDDQVKKLADIILMSALEGLDQFYEAYVSFTSVFGYNHSSMCVSIAEVIPEMTVVPPTQVERRQWVSACESLTNASIAAGREGKGELSNRLIVSGMNFANEICTSEMLSSFDARCVAKAYNIGKKPEKAIDAISKVAEADVNHWLLYEKSKAYLELGRNEDALSCAKSCFTTAQSDQKAAARRSIYHDLISRCHEALGDYKGAKKELIMAIDCSKDNYEAELKERLSKFEGR
jgi:tetratricopeptide (TPR) repeat protein